MTRPSPSPVPDDEVELATDADFERIAGLIEHAKRFNPQSGYVDAKLFPSLLRITATARAAASDRVVLVERIATMREALEWYANPEIYRPHPHGPAFDDRDLSFKARAALIPLDEEL